jgi:SAM-dependent methyltransferase
MDNHADFQHINMAKADFEAIYGEPDPRAYYRVLGGLDYVVPGLAAPALRQLIAARAATQSRPVTVLDLGCSYGVTSALLRYPLTLDMLRRRYMNPEIQAISPERLLELDRAYFLSWPAASNLRIVGLDPASRAVRYAREAGLLDIAIDEDLERQDPSAHARAALCDIDIIVSTGCVGYVGSRTFERILECNLNATSPWVAAFVLRMFPYDEISGTLDRFGLRTQKFEGATFVQRRFYNAYEYESMVSTLESRGIDPTGLEADGLLHAELFVSRPDDAIAAQPLSKLVSIVSGQRIR